MPLFSGNKTQKVVANSRVNGKKNQDSGKLMRTSKKTKKSGIARGVKTNVTPIDMYVDMLVNKLTHGFNENPPKLADDELRTGISSVYTKNYIKKSFLLKEYPEYLDRNFMEIIRGLAGGRVSVMFTFNVTPYQPNWESRIVQRRMRAFARAFDRGTAKNASKDTEQQLFTTQLEREVNETNQRMINSFKHIQEVARTTRQLAKVYCNVDLWVSYINDSEGAQQEMREAFDRINRYLASANVKVYRPFMNVIDYLRSFQPAFLDKNSTIRNLVLPTMLDDNSIAKFYSFIQGKIAGKGVYIGTDVMTKLPISKQFNKKTDAQNIFVVAQTGKGKSFYFKTELLYFRANGYRVAVVDYEGDEYTPIGLFLGAKIISFSVNNGNYFDTTEIGALTGIEEIDKDLKEEAIHATEHIFDLLIDPENGMTNRQAAIFGDIISAVYADLGVTEDRKTWVNSEGASYFMLFGKLQQLMRDEKYYAKYSTDLDWMYDSLRRYFSSSGTKSKMFQSRVSINDIKSSPFVIFSFGMKGANKQTISAGDLALRQSSVAYLITLYSNHNKAVEKKFSVVAIEEVQRYWETKGASSIISDLITGARKRDVVSYLMSNSPLSIIKALTGEAMAVKENITTVLIGRLEEQTAIAVAEAFDIQDCIPHLVNIARNKTYNHCFLAAMDKEEFAIIKAEVKPSLAESELFKTRNVEEDKENPEENVDYSIDQISSSANIDFGDLMQKVRTGRKSRKVENKPTETQDMEIEL